MAEHNIANLNGVFDKMRQKWKDLPEEGYIYTITIDDTCKISALGLADVSAHLSLSCSHPGYEATGLYAGELALEYTTNYGGVATILGALGGGVAADTEGWFKNDKFVMNLVDYKESDEEEFNMTIGSLDGGEVGEALGKAVGELLNATNGMTPKEFETSKPVGMWCDWEYRMTEGDMSQWANISVLGGMGHGTMTQSNDGHSIVGDTHVHVPIAGSFSDHYDKNVDGPFPYTIKMYGDDVVFTLYGSNGMACMKWYGKVDKIPVSETIKVQ